MTNKLTNVITYELCNFFCCILLVYYNVDTQQHKILDPPLSMLDYYIARFILYFPRIVICIFLGLYRLAYIRPSLVLVIYSL